MRMASSPPLGFPPGHSIAGLPLYPHVKLTREEFPRLLATRIIKDDGDEYFGAFLTKTSVRILIDFLNRTFRLRSCDIDIDGSFPVPCTQYFAKRCLAPCVASLCSGEFHTEVADVVRLFLQNERESFVAEISRKIEASAEKLNYETAAFWRDVLKSVEAYWSKPRWQIWLDDAVDTYEVEEVGGTIRIYLITQRGRHLLGSRVFEFERVAGVAAAEAVGDVIHQFYVHHLPKEIRVPMDFKGRRELTDWLGHQFGRKVSIKVSNPAERRVTAERAMERARHKFELENVASRKSAEAIGNEIRNVFGLSEAPVRIEAFDIAHISATGFAGGMSVLLNGEMRPELFRYWLSDRGSELDALRSILANRFSESSGLPDLILIDGGIMHLNTAVEALRSVRGGGFFIVSAVKPRGRHSAVSHFLTEDGRRIEFDPSSDAHLLLRTLRDEAHSLANDVHRQSRDMLHYYERRGLKPLIVPIRFVERGGKAHDLRPIVTRL